MVLCRMHVFKSAGSIVSRLMKSAAQLQSILLQVEINPNHRRHSHLTQSSGQSVNRLMYIMKLPGQLLTASWKGTMVSLFCSKLIHLCFFLVFGCNEVFLVCFLMCLSP